MDEHTILVMAYNHLEEHGWTRGWGDPSHGPTCLVGAIYRVANKRTDGLNRSLALRVLGFTNVHQATTWNDRQRSHRKVLKRLKKGIKATRPPAQPKPIEMQPQLASTHEHDLPT